MRLAQTFAAPTLILAALLLAASPAHASNKKDIRLLSESKLTLSDAIQKAEASQSGKAIKAEIDDRDNKPIYKVSVVRDSNVYKVDVDANNGNILKIRDND